MLWIALYLPELSLQLANRAMPSNTEMVLPLVIANGQVNRPIVFAANSAAQDIGIKVGMTIASARALVDDLCVRPRQLEEEGAAIQNFAAWACQYTPSVSVKNGEGIVVEVSSTLMMHEGLSMLLGKMRRGSHELGYQISCGVAPTPLAAWIFAKARHHGYAVRTCVDICNIESRLGDLPLALLDWPHSVLSTLSGLGIMRFADCFGLPSEDL